MTLAERKVARLLAKAVVQQKKIKEQIDKAREELQAVGCTHPREKWEDYDWEHDNGYGRQTRYRGIQCGLCRATDHYRSWERV